MFSRRKHENNLPHVLLCDSHITMYYLVKRFFNPDEDRLKQFSCKYLYPFHIFDDKFGVLKHPFITTTLNDSVNVTAQIVRDITFKQRKYIDRFEKEFNKYLAKISENCSRAYFTFFLDTNGYAEEDFDDNKFYAVSMDSRGEKLIPNEDGLPELLDLMGSDDRVEVVSRDLNKTINVFTNKKVPVTLLGVPINIQNTGVHDQPRTLEAYKAILEHFSGRTASLEGIAYKLNFGEIPHMFGFQKDLEKIEESSPMNYT